MIWCVFPIMFITTWETMSIICMQGFGKGSSFGEPSRNDHLTGWFGHLICFD